MPGDRLFVELVELLRVDRLVGPAPDVDLLLQRVRELVDEPRDVLERAVGAERREVLAPDARRRGAQHGTG
jgi:hypothetical protein